MDQTPPNTSQWNQALARQAERDDHILDSPQHHQIPHHVRMKRLAPAVPLPLFHAPPSVAGPVQHDDPFNANYAQPPAHPVYQHLPPDLAQRLAALPPLLPVHSRGCGCGHGHGQPPVWNANLPHQNPPVQPMPNPAMPENFPLPNVCSLNSLLITMC